MLVVFRGVAVWKAHTCLQIAPQSQTIEHTIDYTTLTQGWGPIPAKDLNADSVPMCTISDPSKICRIIGTFPFLSANHKKLTLT